VPLPRLGPPDIPVDTSFLPVFVRNNPAVKQALGDAVKAAYALGAGDGFSVGFSAGEGAGFLGGLFAGLLVASVVVVVAACVISILRPHPPRCAACSSSSR